MRIGIPAEVKPMEGRVALVPEAAGELARAGHEVFVQAGAGDKCGYPDSAYEAQGIRVVADAGALYDRAQLVAGCRAESSLVSYRDVDGPRTDWTPGRPRCRCAARICSEPPSLWDTTVLRLPLMRSLRLCAVIPEAVIVGG